MARVQLVIPDADRAMFVQQAKKEGLSFSAWLRAAAQDRLEKSRNSRRFASEEDLREFFKRIDERHEREGLGPEPDWEEHKRWINTPRPSVQEAARNSMPDVDWDALGWVDSPPKP